MTEQGELTPAGLDHEAASTRTLGMTRFHLQLERVRLRAIAARHRRDGDGAALNRTIAELAAVDVRLADAPAGHRDTRLAALLGLTSDELELLWAAVAATVDPALSPHLRDLAGSEARHGISLALHAVVANLDLHAARTLSMALTPRHPLLRYELLLVSGDGVPATRPLTAAPRLAAYLADIDEIDEAVLHIGGVVRVDSAPHFDQAQLECVRQIATALDARDPVLVVIEGPPEIGKRTAAAVAALGLQRSIIQIDVTRLAAGVPALEHAFCALRRECLLDDALPLVAHIDELVGNEGEGRARIQALARLLDETPIPVIATVSTAGFDLGTERTVLRVTMPAPDVSARRVLWQDEIGDNADVDVDLLATRYQVGAGGIRRAMGAARLLAGDVALTTHELVEGVRNGIAERLGELAHRVEVKQSWSDLVLGPDTSDQIKALVARIEHGPLVHEQWGFSAKLPRGLGTAALFSGPPGTGKTMVAGLIARALDLELYQVDLSKVVSKGVGETEKQLAKIFDAAEAGHALLLFDEADSLFAKRTEVKSAIDRYANLEVNYLLQRIESFGGISILTTNLDTSIDPALRRRLAAHIVFYPPEPPERATLWRRLIAPGAPTSGSLDFDQLADEFPDMTGANIRNAVLAAAFLAASEKSRITQAHLRRAGRGEYRAMGRVIH